MKVLFIGGTGNISTACSKLAISQGIDLYHLNRGNKRQSIEGVQSLKGDITNREETYQVLQKHQWDAIVNFIAFNSTDIQRDFELFKGKVGQYIFISSASCYQTPLSHPVITESTPLYNPSWDYSNQKILAERKLMALYAKEGFPVTIVRPSHTYDTVIPIALGGFKEFTTAQRILNGKPIIIHGNGKLLWAVTHSEDFAKGLVPLLGMRKSIGHAFHITSDEILTWNSIYLALANALERPLQPVYISTETICKHAPLFRGSLDTDKSECVIFDNSKIKSYVPDFKATILFEKGIKRTIEWFMADPSRRVIDPEKDAIFDKLIKRFG
jgi:nucleoside-diphosphate-sugar epimerase